MPKKSKKIAEDKKVQKKPDLTKQIPVVNGVQSRLGWLPPYSNKEANYYMPKGDYDNQTRENFSKLLKDRFGLNLEGNPEDAAKRIFTYNNRSFIDDYLQSMEEVDLMPDCKEKFQKKATIARELERGLFYEMAKGALAIVPLGEYEPRQVLCDKDKNVFTVTEPFSQSDPKSMHQLYTSYVEKEVPDNPFEPRRPFFSEKEPDTPKPPAPFTMKAPGKKPEPPKLKAFTLKEPDIPRNILTGRTREDLYKEVYDKMLRESKLIKPELPKEEVKHPGKFTLEEPKVPEKRDYGPLPKEPEKPEGYDAAKYRYDELNKEAEALKPKRDPLFQYTRFKPAPFDKKEPQKPVLDLPDPPIPPTYKTVPGKPQPQYTFYKPALKLLAPEIENPGEMPQPGKFPDEPKKPVLRDEPLNPGGFKRAFSWMSSSWRQQIADHDAWLRERDSMPQKLEKFEQDHAKWQAQCIKQADDYNKVLQDYNAKKVAWDDAVNELEPENEMRRMAYKAALNDYEKDKQRLGPRFEAEKAAYEMEVADWEAKNEELTKAAEAENAVLKAKYDKECEEFDKIEKEYNLNYEGCAGDPDLIRIRRQQLETKFKFDQQEFKNAKEAWEMENGQYELGVQGVYEMAQRAGRDPQKTVEEYKQYMEQVKAYDAKTEEIADFMENNLELGKYDSEREEYEQELELRKEAEDAHQERMEDYKVEHDEWQAKKDAYDRALAKYESYKAVLGNAQQADEDYKAGMDKLKRDAERETDRLIKENEQEIADYPNKVNEYNKEKRAYNDAYWNWKQGCYDMEKPGGLIYKWEQNVKEYNTAKQAYEQSVKKYENDVKTYPDRLKNYNTKLNQYLSELERYNGQVAHYEKQKQKINSIRLENQHIRTAHIDKINENPIYQDYSYKSNLYDYGHHKWEEKLIGNWQYNANQTTDAEKYKKQQIALNKEFEKRKGKAPAVFSGDEAKAYNERVQEYNYLKKFPDGMKGYMKSINTMERAFNDDMNTKFKKDADISLKDYKKAAVEKMYYSVVRNTAEKYSEREYFQKGSTQPIDKLLTAGHSDKAIKAMSENPKIMKAIEQEYDKAKSMGKVAASLQNSKKLCDIYDAAYTPETSKEATKDPVLEKYRGSAEAVNKAMQAGK